MVAAAEADGWPLNCVVNTQDEFELDHHPNVFGLEPEPELKLDNQIECSFDNFIKCFLREVFALEDICFLPPMLGDGQSLDLLKLFLIVRDKGGYDAVSVNGLWGVVAVESGYGPGLASSVKVVYLKYLDALRGWLERLVAAKEGGFKFSAVVERGDLSKLGPGFEEFVREFSGSSKNRFDASDSIMREVGLVGDEESTHTGLGKRGKSGDSVEKSSVFDSFLVESKEIEDMGGTLLSDSRESVMMSDKGKGKSTVVEIGEGDKCSGKGDGDENYCEELDSNLVEMHVSLRKRKRECMYKILNWVTGIARDPCDPEVGSLPERSTWSSYGNEEIWKQAFLVREELFLKRQFESTAEQSAWQKYQKMHPCMYDDHIGSTYNLRDRFQCIKKPRAVKSLPQACSQASSSASQTYSGSYIDGNYDVESSTENSALDFPAEKYIPLGPRFQAEVPKWTGVICESESKWIGTRVWPLKNPRNEFIVEREPIGRGRQDSCGCRVPKSIECVRFHCSERKIRMKRELGAAFRHWGFDKMGEEVRLSWTKEEEKRFGDIVRSNPLSRDKCFWDELFKCFPTKGRQDLVSYYYSVFLFRRRANQNRLTPDNINSDDDDELECGLKNKGNGHEGSKLPGSLLCSSKKQRK